MIAGEKILAEKTLIIFDEIRERPEVLNTLKYFKEKTNKYHVIAVGSLLGTFLAQPKSYFLAMVNLLDIYPLTFDEFLEATDESGASIVVSRKSSRSRNFSSTGCWRRTTII